MRKPNKRKTKYKSRLNAQSHCCYVCGKRFTKLKSVPYPSDATEDHVVPRHLFRIASGSREYEHNPHINNVLLAHYNCNKARGSRGVSDDDYMFLSAVNLIITYDAYFRHKFTGKK